MDIFDIPSFKGIDELKKEEYERGKFDGRAEALRDAWRYCRFKQMEIEQDDPEDYETILWERVIRHLKLILNDTSKAYKVGGGQNERD